MGLIVSLAPPAHAETIVFFSPRSPDVPSQMDLRKIRVVNDDDVVKATFKLRELHADRRARVELVYTPRNVEFPYVIRLHRKADGTKRAQLWLSDGAHGFQERLPCPELTSVWLLVKDKARMSLPHTCFTEGNAQRARVKALAGFFRFFGPGDWTRFFPVRRG